jgi:site-specific recombinase XerD
MFEELYHESHSACKRHLKGPFADERAQFLRYLKDQSYVASTLKFRAAILLALAKDTCLLEKVTISRSSVATEIRKATKLRGGSLESQIFRFKFALRVAIQWLIFLKKLEPNQTEKSEAVRSRFPLILQYVSYLKNEKGAAPVTRLGLEKNAVRFLHWLMVENIDLKDLKFETVDNYVNFKGKTCSRRSMSRYVCDLRQFFRFCEANSIYQGSVVGALQAPRIYYCEKLPSGPSWESVQKVLGEPNLNTATGARDRAILLLLAVYGLRSSEVVSLRIDDIDWIRNTIMLVRAKNRRQQIFPLTKEIGEAIILHLKNRQQTSVREIFLRFQKPIEPLKSGSLPGITKRYYRQAGINPPHWGPHSLRHARATNLINKQLSLKEIADHLGQVSLEATRIYAKVDLSGLRQVGDFDLGGLV